MNKKGVSIQNGNTKSETMELHDWWIHHEKTQQPGLSYLGVEKVPTAHIKCG
jgi:hypothetical protein